MLFFPDFLCLLTLVFSLTLSFLSLDEDLLPLPGLEGRSVAGSHEVNFVCNPVLNGDLGKEFLTNVVTKHDSLIISSEVEVLEGNKYAFILSSVHI